MERMRYIAQAGGVGDDVLVHEVAEMLLDTVQDPLEMVAAARRVLAHQPSCAPLVWLCAHMLVSMEPHDAAVRCVDRIERQCARDVLADELDESASVLVVGDADVCAGALERRPDITTTILTTSLSGHRVARRLDTGDRVVTHLDLESVSVAVRRSELVLVEPQMTDELTSVYPLGAAATVAVAGAESVPVWAVVGEGCALPSALFTAAVRRLGCAVDDSRGEFETTTTARIDRFVSSAGTTAAPVIDCPLAAELCA